MLSFPHQKVDRGIGPRETVAVREVQEEQGRPYLLVKLVKNMSFQIVSNAQVFSLVQVDTSGCEPGLGSIKTCNLTLTDQMVLYNLTYTLGVTDI